MNEIWKDIKGYEKLYQISNFGRVKSFHSKKVKTLKQSVDSEGYLKVSLAKNKKYKTTRVHILMAIVFLGHKPNGLLIVVDHKDNDKSNNHISNLQLVTQRHNVSKDRKNGTSKHTGVYFESRSKRWVSTITIDKKLIYLGSYTDELKAAKAYKRKLKQLNLS